MLDIKQRIAQYLSSHVLLQSSILRQCKNINHDEMKRLEIMGNNGDKSLTENVSVLGKQWHVWLKKHWKNNETGQIS